MVTAARARVIISFPAGELLVTGTRYWNELHPSPPAGGADGG
ncbi:MAG: hypothetical protein ACREPI_00980 [Candidatus Dormibacterales bacterium]